MTAESDCHTSGPPPGLKMDLLQAMEDFVRAWLRSESTIYANCIHTKGLLSSSSHHLHFAFGMLCTKGPLFGSNLDILNKSIKDYALYSIDIER
jgi:hypothetical protein